MASRTWSAIPIPADPEPKITTLISESFSLLTCNPPIIAANVMHPVPCTSSLKQASSGRYRSRRRLAFVKPKSSLVECQLIVKQRGYESWKIQMQIGSRIQLFDRLNKFIHEIVILSASDTSSWKAKVELVMEELFVLLSSQR